MGRRPGRVAAVFGAGLALSACSTVEKLVPEGSGSALGNLIAFGTTKPGPAQAAARFEEPLRCPTIQVLEGTAAYRTYAGADQANSSVRYQYSMGEVARDCTRSGSDVLIKVGVEGRVLLGPAGAPGAFNVPVRVVVRRDSDQKPVASKLYQVPASITGGADATDFQLVTEPLSVPFTRSNVDDDYTILVGFDAAGKAPVPAGADRKRRRGTSTATGTPKT